MICWWCGFCEVQCLVEATPLRGKGSACEGDEPSLVKKRIKSFY